MDALISLPALSLLFVPALTSYSTTLNVFFFYLTWSTLVLSHSPLNVEVFGTLAIRTLVFIVPSLVFLGFDFFVPSLAQSAKAHGKAALPQSLGNRKVGLVVGWAVANILFGVALQAGIEYGLTIVLGQRSALKVTTTLPLPWAVIKHLVAAFVIRGTLGYFIHRYVLHTYKSPLKTWHESWHHGIECPFSIASAYDHPAVYLVHKWLPIYLPAYFFRFHVLTFHIFTVLVSVEELFVYSGYSILPSTTIMTGMARRQDMHMLSGGDGNFAPWGMLDWVAGTTVGQDVMDDIKEEMDKRNVQERAGRALDKASDELGDAASRMKNKGKFRSGNKKK